jgi:hypothetical protein
VREAVGGVAVSDVNFLAFGGEEFTSSFGGPYASDGLDPVMTSNRHLIALFLDALHHATMRQRGMGYNPGDYSFMAIYLKPLNRGRGEMEERKPIFIDFGAWDSEWLGPAFHAALRELARHTARVTGQQIYRLRRRGVARIEVYTIGYSVGYPNKSDTVITDPGEIRAILDDFQGLTERAFAWGTGERSKARYLRFVLADGTHRVFRFRPPNVEGPPERSRSLYPPPLPARIWRYAY